LQVEVPEDKKAIAAVESSGAKADEKATEGEEEEASLWGMMAAAADQVGGLSSRALLCVGSYASVRSFVQAGKAIDSTIDDVQSAFVEEGNAGGTPAAGADGNVKGNSSSAGDAKLDVNRGDMIPSRTRPSSPSPSAGSFWGYLEGAEAATKELGNRFCLVMLVRARSEGRSQDGTSATSGSSAAVQEQSSGPGGNGTGEAGAAAGSEGGAGVAGEVSDSATPPPPQGASAGAGAGAGKGNSWSSGERVIGYAISKAVPRESRCEWAEEMTIEFCPFRAIAAKEGEGAASEVEVPERYYLRFQVFDQLPRDHVAASDSAAGSTQSAAISDFDLDRVSLVGCADVPVDVPGGDAAAASTKRVAVGLRLGEAGRVKGVVSASLSCAPSFK
jgi:hypothetical protein